MTFLLRKANVSALSPQIFIGACGMRGCADVCPKNLLNGTVPA
jgi:hypothetical protein